MYRTTYSDKTTAPKLKIKDPTTSAQVTSTKIGNIDAPAQKLYQETLPAGATGTPMDSISLYRENRTLKDAIGTSYFDVYYLDRDRENAQDVRIPPIMHPSQLVDNDKNIPYYTGIYGLPRNETKKPWLPGLTERAPTTYMIWGLITVIVAFAFLVTWTLTKDNAGMNVAGPILAGIFGLISFFCLANGISKCATKYHSIYYISLPITGLFALIFLIMANMYDTSIGAHIPGNGLTERAKFIMNAIGIYSLGLFISTLMSRLNAQHICPTLTGTLNPHMFD